MKALHEKNANLLKVHLILLLLLASHFVGDNFHKKEIKAWTPLVVIIEVQRRIRERENEDGDKMWSGRTQRAFL